MSEEIQSTPPTKGSVPIAVKVVLAVIVLSMIGVIYNIAHTDNRARALAILSNLQSPGSSANQATAPAQSGDPMTDKSFHLDSVSFQANSGFGGADARITNISNAAKTAIFNISIFTPDGVTVASVLTGSAENVQPGQTVTVQFVSFKDLPSQEGTYAFQVTTEY